MLLSNVVCSVEVGIELIATGSAVKDTLRTAIVACLIPTLRARLQGVARINLDHLHAPCLRFVGDKGVELLKAPTVQAALPFAFSEPGTLANTTQILYSGEQKP